MKMRALSFVTALLLLVAGGVWLSAWTGVSEAGQAEPSEQAVAPEPPAASLSPSQEVRAKINEIRANEFFYQSYGKNDPFRTLVRGEFEQSTPGELVDLSSARLVGVMWGQAGRFALVEDGEGFGYILRAGDEVRHGRIVSIRKNSLTARITLYGITSTVVLKLERTEG
jgi:hypothetical protein